MKTTRTLRNLTTLETLIRKVALDPRYDGIRWIVNVLTTGCGKPVARVRALMALVDAGRDVRPAQFVMPYECLVVDGQALVAMALLDKKLEIPYNPTTWQNY